MVLLVMDVTHLNHLVVDKQPLAVQTIFYESTLLHREISLELFSHQLLGIIAECVALLRVVADYI